MTRRLAHWAPAAAAAACLLAGCASRLAPLDRDPQLLNSERIERRFGSSGLEVLEVAGPIRVANLYSDEGGRRVCRTFAVTRLPEEVDPRVAAEHERVLAGGSIGAVFAASGWTIGKHHDVVAEIPPPRAGDRVAQLMDLSRPPPLAATVYRFTVSRDGASVDYATIAEVYHPDYLRLDDLRAMLGDVPATPSPGSVAAEQLRLVAEAVRGPLLARLSQAAPAGPMIGPRRREPAGARKVVRGEVDAS
jgi:hypothetical protein